MATSTELWDAFGPEFAGDAQSLKDIFLSEAAAQISATIWGVEFQRGAVYLALHMRALAARGERGEDGAGPIIGEKTGDLSVNYGATSAIVGGDSFLGTTRFGLEFVRIRKMVTGGPRVVEDTSAAASTLLLEELL